MLQGQLLWLSESRTQLLPPCSATVQPYRPCLACAAGPCFAGIEEAEGLPIDQVILLYQGHEPKDHETLAGSGITNGCILHLVLKLRGD